jgi:hypothetical protein
MSDDTYVNLEVLKDMVIETHLASNRHEEILRLQEQINTKGTELARRDIELSNGEKRSSEAKQNERLVAAMTELGLKPGPCKVWKVRAADQMSQLNLDMSLRDVWADVRAQDVLEQVPRHPVPDRCVPSSAAGEEARR